MSSFLSWVDYSEAEQERIHRAIALLREHEARDELGLGTVRDVFSDALFPGTSTIQTRLRYFLFIPWIYQRLEQRRLVPPRLGQRLRAAELALIEPLDQSDDSDGNFGSRSRETLKRLPSSVYWNGIRRWGILHFDGSQGDYHRSLERIYRMRESSVRPDDAGVELDRLATWHEQLPLMPEEFPEGISFALPRHEAEYLQDRIVSACKGSMLEQLAQNGKSSDVDAPWLHPDVGAMPKDVKATLDLARRFSLVMHGAALLYNLILAEKSDRADASELRDRYRQELVDWASGPERDGLAGWRPQDIWSFVADAGAVVPKPTALFVEAWMSRLLSINPHQMADDVASRQLIRDRELRLKGKRSRIHYERPLEQWRGASGTRRLNYRWPVVQRLLNDLCACLHPEEA